MHKFQSRFVASKNLWTLVLALAIALALTALAAGQVITFVWLSSFPERAAQLASLEAKAISYGVAFVLLVAVDVFLTATLVWRVVNKRVAADAVMELSDERDNDKK